MKFVIVVIFLFAVTAMGQWNDPHGPAGNEYKCTLTDMRSLSAYGFHLGQTPAEVEAWLPGFEEEYARGEKKPDIGYVGVRNVKSAAQLPELRGLNITLNFVNNKITSIQIIDTTRTVANLEEAARQELPRYRLPPEWVNRHTEEYKMISCRPLRFYVFWTNERLKKNAKRVGRPGIVIELPNPIRRRPQD